MLQEKRVGYYRCVVCQAENYTCGHLLPPDPNVFAKNPLDHGVMRFNDEVLALTITAQHAAAKRETERLREALDTAAERFIALGYHRFAADCICEA